MKMARITCPHCGKYLRMSEEELIEILEGFKDVKK